MRERPALVERSQARGEVELDGFGVVALARQLLGAPEESSSSVTESTRATSLGSGDFEGARSESALSFRARASARTMGMSTARTIDGDEGPDERLRH